MISKIKLLGLIPFYKLNRSINWPKMMPVNFTFSLTADCNSRCQTCKIWQKTENDLTLEEWEKILSSIGEKPFWITISGGEPFLKSYLSDFVKLCYQKCRPAIINIPTNCLMADLIPKKVEEMCQSIGKTQLIINLSVDGVGDKHDKIRGVEGNFDRVEKTLKSLKVIQKKYSNLVIGIHSVISTFNYQDVDELFAWVFSMKPDQFITEIAEQRTELNTKGLSIAPTLENYSEVIDKLMTGLKEQKFQGVSRVTEAFREEYYNLVKNYLKTGKQVIPCYAGIASTQIYCQGDIWECCVEADSFGNLRDNNYDFKKVWFSDETERVRKRIKDKECACPLANASYTNLLLNFRTLFKVLINYL